MTLLFASQHTSLAQNPHDFPLEVIDKQNRPLIGVRHHVSRSMPVPMIEDGLPPEAVRVVDPVNAAPGRIMQRQAIFDAVRPTLGWLDPLGPETDPVSARKLEFIAIKAEQHLLFVVCLSYISSYLDLMSQPSAFPGLASTGVP